MPRRALASPRPWLFAAILWAVTLYLLSSFRSIVPGGEPESGGLGLRPDKILHFGYFMGGAFLYTTHLLLRHGPAARPFIRLLLPMLLFALIGALDEFHQSLRPGRSGNDLFDWLADALGAVTGVLLANLLHPLLRKLTALT